MCVRACVRVCVRARERLRPPPPTQVVGEGEGVTACVRACERARLYMDASRVSPFRRAFAASLHHRTLGSGEPYMQWDFQRDKRRGCDRLSGALNHKHSLISFEEMEHVRVCGAV